jgi:hypothetical protein
MKNRILLFLGSAALCSVVLTGCSEDDAIAPQISLVGSADTVIAKGSVWNDPMAIATDDVDGDISAGIVVSGSVNTNVAGVYELTYTATDEAGNSNSVTRTVTVSWTGSQLAFNYSATEICPPDSITYSILASASSGSPFRVNLNTFPYNFSNFTYADIIGDELTIPVQRPNGASSDIEVSGTGTISQVGSSIVIEIQYLYNDLGLNITSNCTVRLVSQ